MLLEYDARSVGVRMLTFRGNLLSSPLSVARSVKVSVFPLNEGTSSAGIIKKKHVVELGKL
jgi:hypothetical protein